MRTSARAFSPASVGNAAVGFDILGHAIAGVGDEVAVRRIEAPEVRIAAIRGAAVALPTIAAENTAGVALIALREALGLSFGFEIEIDKGIPLGSGMGGSAASCVAALVAANALLEAPLSRQALYPFALAGEAVASGGRHGDNLGPMLLGGLVLATADRLTTEGQPPGSGWWIATRAGRRRTPRSWRIRRTLRRALRAMVVAMCAVPSSSSRRRVRDGCWVRSSAGRGRNIASTPQVRSSTIRLASSSSWWTMSQ